MKKFVSITTLIILLYSCYSGKMVKDEEIDIDLRKEMRSLTEQVIKGCAQNEPQLILKLATNSFREDFRVSLERDIIQKGFVFDLKKYSVLNEFYLEGVKKGIQVNISSGSAPEDYYLRIIPQSNKVYLSLGYFNIQDEQISLILLWVKKSDKWLLNYMHAGVIEIAHKNLHQWFNEVKKHYKQGEVCDAGMKLMIVSKLLNKNLLPIIYNNENKLKEEGRKIIQDINSRLNFPYKMKELVSQLSILRFVPIIVEDTLVPVAQYVSQINNREEVSLKNECDSLHEILGEIYKGIDKNNSKIIYQVFDSIPNDNQAKPHHTFVKEFKN